LKQNGATTTLAVLKRVADEHPRPIREVIPEVPAWFCRIVEKLHAKEPADDSRRLAKWRTCWPTAKRS
jgi:hypothetical protein